MIGPYDGKPLDADVLLIDGYQLRQLVTVLPEFAQQQISAGTLWRIGYQLTPYRGQTDAGQLCHDDQV